MLTSLSCLTVMMPVRRRGSSAMPDDVVWTRNRVIFAPWPAGTSCRPTTEPRLASRPPSSLDMSAYFERSPHALRSFLEYMERTSFRRRRSADHRPASPAPRPAMDAIFQDMFPDAARAPSPVFEAPDTSSAEFVATNSRSPAASAAPVVPKPRHRARHKKRRRQRSLLKLALIRSATAQENLRHQSVCLHLRNWFLDLHQLTSLVSGGPRQLGNRPRSH